MAASPRTRLARLEAVDRNLLLLLVSLGPELARDRLACLAAERRELLAPLVAEISALPAPERRALFAAVVTRPPDTAALNRRLQRERPRLAALLIRELAPRDAAPVTARDPAFGRTLAHLAARWLSAARR